MTAKEYARTMREELHRQKNQAVEGYKNKVIERIKNMIEPTDEYRHRFCGTVTPEYCVKHEDCECCIAEQIIKILESAE